MRIIDVLSFFIAFTYNWLDTLIGDTYEAFRIVWIINITDFYGWCKDNILTGCTEYPRPETQSKKIYIKIDKLRK